MSTSKTKNSFINMLVGGGAQILYIFSTFIARTIFIKLLNIDYLGINGLFTNILTILSFSELGISSALVYSMYKPAKNNNNKLISSLLNLYRKAYNIIAFVILFFGCILIPFIPKLINGDIKIVENITIIYVLFLLHTVASYLFSYRKSLFTIFQKDYIITAVDRGILIGMTIIQLVFLYYTRNYYIYLFISIITVLLINVTLHVKAGERYAEIIKIKPLPIPVIEKQVIISNVRNIFFYKIGNISLNATDNIVVNALINISTVGLNANYVMLINGVQTVIDKAFYGIVASLGNLNASDDTEKKIKVMEELTTLTYWFYGVVSILLVLLLNDAIYLWLGPDYQFNNIFIIISMVLSFYVFGANLVASNYRTTMGFFKEAKYAPSIAAILNIFLSIVLGNLFGLSGVFIATAITRFLTFSLFDPIIVYKKGFNKNVLFYYVKYFYFLILTIFIGVFCGFLIRFIVTINIISFIVKIFVILILSNVLYYILLRKTAEFSSLMFRIKKILKK